MAVTPGKSALTESRMAMWRSLVAFAYVDGTLVPAERQSLADYVKANAFTPQQRDQILADIDKGVKLADVYPGITDVKDRGDLLTLGRVLFYADKDFSAAEQRAYDEIHKDQERAVDFHLVEARARENDKKYKLQEQLERQTEYKKEGRVQRVLDWLSGLPDYFFGSDDD